jgi:preprotein translocase subunit SecA
MRQLERFILLTLLDRKWKDHLHEMDQMKSSIGLRGYAQVDPKVEYKKEGFFMFREMLDSLKDDVTDRVLKVTIKRDERVRNHWNIAQQTHEDYAGQFAQHKAAQDAAADGSKQPIKTIRGGKAHPRNAPCPCGSGKKYKRCCGAGA